MRTVSPVPPDNLVWHVFIVAREAGVGLSHGPKGRGVRFGGQATTTLLSCLNNILTNRPVTHSSNVINYDLYHPKSASMDKKISKESLIKTTTLNFTLFFYSFLFTLFAFKILSFIVELPAHCNPE